MLQLFSNASDPMAFMKQKFGSNPKFKALIDMLDGKNPQQKEQIMRNYLKEQGINPDGLINTIRQFGLKI